MLGLAQVLYDLFLLPETLEVAKRRPIDLAAALNPFGFLNLFRKGEWIQLQLKMYSVSMFALFAMFAMFALLKQC